MDNIDASSQSSKKSSGKGRGVAFHPLDDQRLAQSWVSVSEDPVTGTDQTKDTFWNAVKVVGDFSARTPESLRQRWGIISRSVSKFCGVLSTVNKLNQSGTTQSDQFNRALQLYERDEGKPFKFLSCFEVLSQCPKFKINCASTAEKASPSPGCSSSKENPTPDTPTGRPTGRDRAKAVGSGDAFEARRTDALERIAAATEQKTKIFAEYTKAINRHHAMKIATTKVDELDPISKKIIILQKQQVLQELTNENWGQSSTQTQPEEIFQQEIDPFEEFIIEDDGEGYNLENNSDF